MDIVVRETDRLNVIITEFLEYARPKTSQNEVITLSSLLTETCILIEEQQGIFPGIND